MGSVGLTAAEAARRLGDVGPNRISPGGRVSVTSSVRAQLTDPLILVLLAACVLTALIGDLSDSIVIAVVVVVNTTVGVAQEIRADRAVAALAQLTTPSVRVRRGGSETSVPSVDLVPGDLVLLGEGDVVPADCDLEEASALLVDESLLTGESVAVGKTAHGPDPHDAAVAAGTVVVKGRAVAVVRRTGSASALGRIAGLMDTRVQHTPLQRRLAGLGRVLAIVTVSLCCLVLVLGVLRGQPVELMVVTAISLAVAAVPESLPAVVTLSLALGARRMASRHAVVRRLPAVETLGSVTVLATDKTGTLTRAQMHVDELWTPHHRVTVLGQGYTPQGDLVCEGRRLDLEDAPDVVDLLTACTLCNDATLVPPSDPDDLWTGLGDPTEVALLAAAAKAGLRRSDLESALPRIDEVPFDSSRQRMSTAHAVPDAGRDEVLVVTKGSVEVLNRVHRAESEAATWLRATGVAEELAGRGHRVIAVATGLADRSPGWEGSPQHLVGLVAMSDPARAAARATIDECRRAGIHPVLITGDHPATARAIAEQVGILHPGEVDVEAVALGSAIVAGAVPDLTVPKVFARTSPEQKLDIVEAWKQSGAVVAMTGDGVNDGPALRRADIGVAMGHRGTEVARQAADLVLADDDLETVVAAVQEGRRVYANIRSFLVFGLSGGAAEILVMLVGPFVGLTVPLTAAQILWVNLLTHGLTGVAIGAEPAAPDILRHPPQPAQRSVLGDGLWQRVALLGSIVATVTLGLGMWAEATQRPWQTMVFLSLTTLQLGIAAGLRPRLVTREGLLLPVALVGSFLLAVAGVYLPALQDLLDTAPLTLADTALVTGLSLVGWGSARATRRRRT